MSSRARSTSGGGRGPAAGPQRGGTLVGMFIGLILGLSLAAAVAYYLSKGGGLTAPSSAASKDAAKAVARGEPAADRGRFDFYKILPGGEEPRIRPPETRPLERADKDKRPETTELARLDAARLDAGKSEPTRPETKAAALKDPAQTPAKPGSAKTDAGKSGDRFYLQAGAFQSEADAENQKARLALAGWEAAIQVASAADRSRLYRVRVGPFDSADEMNRIRTELGKRGFDVAVIKNP